MPGPREYNTKVYLKLNPIYYQVSLANGCLFYSILQLE